MNILTESEKVCRVMANNNSHRDVEENEFFTHNCSNKISCRLLLFYVLTQKNFSFACTGLLIYGRFCLANNLNCNIFNFKVVYSPQQRIPCVSLLQYLLP